MKLYEKEAKKILEESSVKIPGNSSERSVVKAQVLVKNRKEHGGIKFAENREEAEQLATQMKSSKVDGHDVEEVLIEDQVEILEEYYVSFLYDTDVRTPVMVFSSDGGTGIENREVSKLELEADLWRIRQFLKENGVESSELNSLASTVSKLQKAFFQNDARMLEVNPLAKTEEGYVAVDAMMDLDDDAAYRHNWGFPERSEFARDKTKREINAEKIDEDDHRGVAGKYTELNGNIAMMLAGGGASLTNMDALIAYGGEPANYTEYGGNPPTEKVYRLSKVIMSKPGLKGLWHVGGTANNTDIFRTMKGFCQALDEIQPDYPIVIRRDGPHADEAFELLRETRDKLDLNMTLYRNDASMTETAKTLMEMVEEAEN